MNHQPPDQLHDAVSRSVKIDGYVTLGHERDTRLSAEQLIQMLDGQGFAAAVIAPEDREIAVMNREGNDRMLELAERHAGRLIPACTVNPWFGDGAAREFGRATKAGARMVVFAPALQGFLPNDDELVSELCQQAAELKVPVYFHTGPHTGGSPAQLAMLAIRHPRTRFILGHGGSTDHAYDLRAVLESKPDNIWFDMSLMRPWAFDALAGVGDESRWIFGSSAPRTDFALEVEHFKHHWPIRLHQRAYGRNLLNVLGLDAAQVGTGAAS